jgi:hypothetical protein
METNLKIFLQEFELSIEDNTFKKMLLSKPSSSIEVINRVRLKLIETQKGKRFSFVYEYPTKHITKSFSIEDSRIELTVLLPQKFKNAVLFTAKSDIRLSYSKKIKSKLDFSKASFTENISTKHNEDKVRAVEIKDNIYLQELGVVTKNNLLAQNMQSKYKQINKFIETIDGLLKSSGLDKKKKLEIVDMGSGKGYLTFSMYDFITKHLNIEAHISGVEIRPELVDLCNSIASKCNFKDLHFNKGDIKSFPIKKTDVLIALHACDTATDDAIFKGIMSGAAVIVTAPCCHKQIRKELNVENEMKDIAKHGILKERLAEMVTDTMRGLMLEAHGYKTQIFEFIADAHTHKNVMIVGVKHNEKVDKQKIIEKIENIKKLFGIKVFYLEGLFEDII